MKRTRREALDFEAAEQMGKVRAEEIVNGSHPTKREIASFGLNTKKRWLRKFRRDLCQHFGIESHRYGPAIVDGIIMRGKAAGMTLEEAPIAVLNAFNGCTHGEVLQAVRDELKRRGLANGQHFSDRAITTCLRKKMTADQIIDFAQKHGLNTTKEAIDRAKLLATA